MTWNLVTYLPKFLWPWALLGLLLLPLVIIWFRRIRGPSVTNSLHSDAALIARAAHLARPGQKLPTVIYILALSAALIAVARPFGTVLVPDDLSGIMLSIETSRSMYAADIAPTRLEATQAAAKAIVDSIPDSIKIGLSTFSGYGVLNAPLTNDHDQVKDAIDNLDFGGNFAFTHGLLSALEALPESEEGTIPGVIVLFSHGHDNTLNDPLEIAHVAAERNILIHTVGVGTHGNNFSEDVLKLIADATGGQYYPIFNAEDLSSAHKDLSKIITFVPKKVELTAFASLLAALLLALSLVLAQLRRRVF